jgi:type VI secretion system protein ImpF
MARWEPEQVVTQSVLERLIDREPGLHGEGPMSRAQSVRLLKSALRRDLEWLLNSRRNPEPAGPEYEETERSLYNYGLPDINSLSWNSSRDRARLAHMIEDAIAIFEPRLDEVKVIPLDTAAGKIQVLRFQIEALLKMDPAPEHISFDTVLQLSTGEYQVKGDASAG